MIKSPRWDLQLLFLMGQVFKVMGRVNSRVLVWGEDFGAFKVNCTQFASPGPNVCGLHEFSIFKNKIQFFKQKFVQMFEI
jgi:hypothetical protein